MNTIANTLRRLAPCTSPRQCAHRTQNNFMTTPNRILQSPDRKARRPQLNLVHRQRPKNRPQNHSPEVRIIIPLSITATAAPAPSFLPPNRKRLASDV